MLCRKTVKCSRVLWAKIAARPSVKQEIVKVKPKRGVREWQRLSSGTSLRRVSEFKARRNLPAPHTAVFSGLCARLPLCASLHHLVAGCCQCLSLRFPPQTSSSNSRSTPPLWAGPYHFTARSAFKLLRGNSTVCGFSMFVADHVSSVIPWLFSDV